MRVCEIFESVQGEGLTVGAPSLFIRTGRCSLGCLFCDTKYSWDSGREYAPKELLREVISQGLPDVVITGGEPFEEEELPLLLELVGNLPFIRRITLETCGHIFKELPSEKLHLVLSPKPPTMGVEFPYKTLVKFFKAYREVELKYTLFSLQDLDLIEEFLFENVSLVPQPVVFQPLHHPKEEYPETFRRVWKMVRERRELLNSFEIRLIPQVHKLVGIK